MSKVIAKLVNGLEKKLETKFEIGEYVEVIKPEHQYSSYGQAFNYFWGNLRNYHIPYSYGERPSIWKIINMALHPSNGKIIYHIRTIDGKNAVVSGDGLRKIDYHKRNRNNIYPIMIYQLCVKSMPHSWKEKLYKVLNENDAS